MNAHPFINICPVDFSNYEKIHIFGDIHGCYTALKEAIGEISDSHLYIFTGDYLDRGPENRQVLEFLLRNCRRRNFILLNGNHEIHLKDYISGGEIKSYDFKVKTIPQICSIDRQKIRNLCSHLKYYLYFKYGNYRYFICHGGIPTIPSSGMHTIAASDLINGVGDYNDYLKIAEIWNQQQERDFIQIFGHRNTQNSPARINDNVYCLEGQVEFGGELRVLEITGAGISVKSKPNHIYDYSLKAETPEFIKELRNNTYLQEKKFSCISSFYFNSRVFRQDLWEQQSVTARGLFVENTSGRIIARGYNKFFNLNELPECTMGNLPQKLNFPVKASVKENGTSFLVFLYRDHLFFATKYSLFNEETGNFTRAFRNIVSEEAEKYLTGYLREHNTTLIFEHIDPHNDPKIIKYSGSRIILLDIISNDTDGRRAPESETERVAGILGVDCRKQVTVLEDFHRLQQWYQEITFNEILPDIPHVEGYVLEDAGGYMLKIKLPFYRFWKYMQVVATDLFNHGSTDKPLDARGRHFYNWLNGKITSVGKETDIITLREMYLKETSAGELASLYVKKQRHYPEKSILKTAPALPPAKQPETAE